MSAAVAAPARTALLRLDGVAKRYGGVSALDGVSVTLRAGEVHALVGENGAGKSTLVKVVAGMVEPDEGVVERLDATAEVAVVHQELSIVPALSVLDNLLLGDPRVPMLYRRAPFRAEARQHLEAVGLGELDLDARADSLTLAQQQLVEIARSLVRRARITLLDEPTATLSDAEIEHVFEVVESLRARDHAIVYISHRLREIFDVADRVTTLRNGRVVASQALGEVTPDLLVEQMIGAAPHRHAAPRAPDTATSSPLRVRGAASPGRFAGVGLDVHAGEVVGMLGQLGSGADAVVSSLAGTDPDFVGEVEVRGRRVPRVTLTSMRALGVSYLSGSRKHDGLFLDFTVEENVTSAILGSLSRGGLVQRAARRERALALMNDFAISGDRVGSPVAQLSGGNQQKVALAKAVASTPSVLLLNEPTRGVDVGARSDIYVQLRRLADRGMAVLCFTSDVAEATELCDRVITMFRGRVVRTRTIGADPEAALLADILHGGDE